MVRTIAAVYSIAGGPKESEMLQSTHWRPRRTFSGECMCRKTVVFPDIVDARCGNARPRVTGTVAHPEDSDVKPFPKPLGCAASQTGKRSQSPQGLYLASSLP